MRPERCRLTVDQVPASGSVCHHWLVNSKGAAGLAAAAVASMAMASCSSCPRQPPRRQPQLATTPAAVQRASDTMPACSTGHGTDGSTATLTISEHGTAFTGTYLNAVPGMASGTSLRYDVAGTAADGRLVSEWTLGSVALRVTGSYTAQVITLDNPGGKFSVTVFRSASGCP